MSVRASPTLFGMGVLPSSTKDYIARQYPELGALMSELIDADENRRETERAYTEEYNRRREEAGKEPVWNAPGIFESPEYINANSTRKEAQRKLMLRALADLGDPGKEDHWYYRELGDEFDEWRKAHGKKTRRERLDEEHGPLER